MGLKSPKGKPIKKLLRVIASSTRLIKHLTDRKCVGDHTHQFCQGAESKRCAHHTIELASLIIVGLCAPETPPNKQKQKQEEPLRQSKDPATLSTEQVVRQEGGFDQRLYLPGISAERPFDPSWWSHQQAKGLNSDPHGSLYLFPTTR